MSEHTPGPWCIDGYNLSVVLHCTAERGSPEARHTSGDYEVIARCEGDLWRENAQLIAAAPEMLATLKLTAKVYRVYTHADQAVLDAIRSAIAKAEGRA